MEQNSVLSIPTKISNTKDKPMNKNQSCYLEQIMSIFYTTELHRNNITRKLTLR